MRLIIRGPTERERGRRACERAAGENRKEGETWRIVDVRSSMVLLRKRMRGSSGFFFPRCSITCVLAMLRISSSIRNKSRRSRTCVRGCRSMCTVFNVRSGPRSCISILLPGRSEPRMRSTSVSSDTALPSTISTTSPPLICPPRNDGLPGIVSSIVHPLSISPTVHTLAPAFVPSWCSPGPAPDGGLGRAYTTRQARTHARGPAERMPARSGPTRQQQQQTTNSAAVPHSARERREAYVSALRQARRVPVSSRASAALVHPTIPAPAGARVTSACARPRAASRRRSL